MADQGIPRLIGAGTSARRVPPADWAARCHQKELELIYASAPVGLCALDRDLRYLRIYDRLAEISGIPAAVHIGLPDMDGLELARRLRALCPERERLLLVALTGYGHDEARERSFAAGFDEHLTKPVDRHALQALLQRLQ